MSGKIDKFLENLVPFIVLGVAIALLICLLFMFFYVVIWGVLIGGLLWLIVVIKEYFFPSRPVTKEPGRIIEHDDKK